MGYHKYKQLFDNKIIQIPYVYKHYIDKNANNEEYFVNDNQTKELKRRHRDTIAFWTEADIDDSVMTDEILLLSMHGSMMEDTDKLVPTIMRIFDFSDMSDILAFAAEVQEIVRALPGGFHNPLLTMNAVATRSTYNRGTYNGHDDSSRRVKDSIIIGDGVLQFLYDSGLESSGPDFVHAHEFGHHLQFQMDMAVPPGSEYVHDDRRKELMADAISGYFLAHDEGGNMMANEIGIFDETAFATGDCSVTKVDHHGTPRQRQCAAIWGASLAATDHVPILDPEVFVNSFNEAYGRILDLDSRECTLVLEETSLDYSPEEEKKEPPLHGIEVGVWNEIADYQEDEERPNINLGDWLESQEGQDSNNDIEWEDPFETADNVRPSSHNNDVPDGQVVSSLMPIDQENSWESRGKPSSYTPNSNYNEGVGTRPNNGEQTSSSLEVTTEGETNPYGNFADRGTPEETRKSYLNHGLSVHDCHMPWVYCQSSSSHESCVSGILYMISALAASSFIILWS